LARHGAMRLVRDMPGALRQPVYLRHDEAMGRALLRHLDYHADRLVIDQRLLPVAWRAGVLGGRHYDVVMTRYPLAALHAALDALATANPGSRTLADFRAPADLVADEAAALAGAERIVTPHHGIADLFGPRAHRLDWVLPAPVSARRGDRVAFLGPAIGRAGLAVARGFAARLRKPLIVFGPDLEGDGAWDGIPVERRAFGPGWLDGIGAIIHPAAMTHQPRRLLQAIANGVRVHATAGAGLAPGQWRPLADFDPVTAG
ncbi:MAG: hypothetical protein PHS60_13110, partial [Zavarzinia sp.]|nr:hypothetical protein [Zavarzinia sp.]